VRFELWVRAGDAVRREYDQRGELGLDVRCVGGVYVHREPATRFKQTRRDLQPEACRDRVLSGADLAARALAEIRGQTTQADVDYRGHAAVELATTRGDRFVYDRGTRLLLHWRSDVDHDFEYAHLLEPSDGPPPEPADPKDLFWQTYDPVTPMEAMEAFGSAAPLALHLAGHERQSIVRYANEHGVLFAATYKSPANGSTIQILRQKGKVEAGPVGLVTEGEGGPVELRVQEPEHFFKIVAPDVPTIDAVLRVVRPWVTLREQDGTLVADPS
jgi:hypothetical protein